MRWQIETLFSCLKGRGFNLEDTHLTKQDRVSKLVAVNALAFCWAYLTGLAVIDDKPSHYKRCLKSNGRPQSSVFALGLDFLIDGFRRFIMCGDFAFFNRLVDFLSFKRKSTLF